MKVVAFLMFSASQRFFQNFAQRTAALAPHAMRAKSPYSRRLFPVNGLDDPPH
jgi:hypothetical protein